MATLCHTPCLHTQVSFHPMLLTPKPAHEFEWAHKHTDEDTYKRNQLAQLPDISQEASQLHLTEFYTALCIVKCLLFHIQKAQKSDFLYILHKLNKECDLHTIG